MRKRFKKLLVFGAGFLALADFSLAQPRPRPMHFEEYPLFTGLHEGPAAVDPSQTLDQAGAAEPELVYSGSIKVGGVPWLRVYFDDFHLGPGSFVRLTSLKDGGDQWLDARAMENWQKASAIFNGDEVGVEVFAAPGDTGTFLNIKNVLVGEWETAPEPPGIFSICDTTDDRVATLDNRACRMYFGGCSAWFTSNGSVLTAGHCTDFDPDQGGPGLPDGVSDIGGVVEVNVPLSLGTNQPVAADPDDQYPIIVGSETWRFDGEGQGLGKDWSVYGVNQNTGPNPHPHRAHGFFRMTNNVPAVATTLRITGFGSDTGTADSTEQTELGPFQGEFTGVNAADLFVTHRVDTTGGSSGSPIIIESNQFCIGIHTNAGCTTGGAGTNSGTSFEVNALETAIADFPGVNTFYVDEVSNSVSELAAIFQPAQDVPLGYSLAPSGSLLSIVEGTYTAAEGNTGTFGEGNKSMFWDAPVGTVIIGD